MFGWTRRAAKDEQILQLFCLQLLVLPGKEFQAGLQRRPPQNSLFEENSQQLFIETRLIVPAQHAFSSTDSAGHAATSGLLMRDKVAPRVLTAPLRLHSNLGRGADGASNMSDARPFVYPPLASLPSQQKGCSTPWEPPPQHPSTAAPRIHVMINGVIEW